MDGEREVGPAVVRDVLDDDVDVDVGVGDGSEDHVGDPRLVGDAHQADLGLVAVEGDAGNDGLFHLDVFLEGDERSRAGFLADVDVPRREARQHAQRHAVLAGELDRADLQHLRAEAGHLEHLLEADGREPPRIGDDARIGRVDAVDVGVDQALGGLQRRGDRDRRGVGAAAAQGRDVAARVDALEAGDDDDLAGVEVGADARVVDLLDPRLGVRDVGRDRHLPAGIAHRRHALGLEREREQADRDLLAGRGDHVELAQDFVGRRLGRRAGARARAGGWSRRSSPRERRRAGAPPSPTWRPGARRSGSAPANPSTCRRTCERSMPWEGGACRCGDERTRHATPGESDSSERRSGLDRARRRCTTRLTPRRVSPAASGSTPAPRPSAASARASMPRPGT